jgi:hypothetical protein
MNWDAVGAIAELLGAIAVFLTLAYLTIQVRQNAKAIAQQNQFSAAQIMQARTDTVMEFNSVVLMDEENLRALTKLQRPGLINLSEEDPVAINRYQMILTMARSMFENAFQQSQQGFLSADFYTGAVVKNVENYAEAFIQFGTPMSAEFRKEVESILNEQRESRSRE